MGRAMDFIALKDIYVFSPCIFNVLSEQHNIVHLPNICGHCSTSVTKSMEVKLMKVILTHLYHLYHMILKILKKLIIVGHELRTYNSVIMNTLQLYVRLLL